MAVKINFWSMTEIFLSRFNAGLRIQLLTVSKVGALNFSIWTMYTSHSAYVATETELDGAKIDGLLPPNFL